MPDTYRKGDFDMAGFAVGVVEKNRIITGKQSARATCILGLASTGLHSNGYALARNICFKRAKLKVTDTIDELSGTTLGDALLAPTRIYVRPILKLLHKYKVKRVVHAMAHITGGGLPGNVPRILPQDCNAVIKKSSWPRPTIFNFLQKTGPVEEEEMFNVFNMGIGYVVIVAEDFADAAARLLIEKARRSTTSARSPAEPARSCSKTESEIRKFEIRPGERERSIRMTETQWLVWHCAP